MRKWGAGPKIPPPCARAVLNGICRETGYAPDVDFLKHLRKQREEG
jgi:hypothetical protein